MAAPKAARTTCILGSVVSKGNGPHEIRLERSALKMSFQIIKTTRGDNKLGGGILAVFRFFPEKF